jgi:dethiobiotin synthetase
MNIFISANNTNSGKTYSTLKLIKTLSNKGYKVGVMKPIETGVKDIPEDGKKLYEEALKYNKNLKNLTLNDIVPIQFSFPAAPIVAGEVDFEKIKKAYNKIKPLCDILLIEGAGGILVPITENFKMIDFIKFFNAKLFLGESLLVVE